MHEEGEYDEDQPPPTVHASKGGKAKPKPPPESDDEEEQGSEEEEGWGRKKSTYYSSNAAELDSEDEEANEMEEQEAMRIQVKARDAMLDDDFGLADVDQGDAEETEECVCPVLLCVRSDRNVPSPFLEPVTVVTGQPTPLDKKAALRQMEKTNPETLALAYDWEDIADKVVRTQEKIKECAMDCILASPFDLRSTGFHLMNQILKH